MLPALHWASDQKLSQGFNAKLQEHGRLVDLPTNRRLGVILQQNTVPPFATPSLGAIRTPQTNWQPWLLFFLRVLAEQVKWLEKKLNVKNGSWPACGICHYKLSNLPVSMAA